MKDARGHGSNARGGGNQTVREQVAMRQSIDARHFPNRTTTDKAALADGGLPKPPVESVPFGQSKNAAQNALLAARQGFGMHAGGVHAIKGKL